MDTVHRNCARVSETEFVETGAVRWDIPRVDAAIALHCPGKYVSLKNIQYFDAFPYVGYSWNSYLLEQYVATVSKNFTLMHSSYAKNNVSGAIVRRDAWLDFFDDVLADILANAPVDLEKDPCLASTKLLREPKCCALRKDECLCIPTNGMLRLADMC